MNEQDYAGRAVRRIADGPHGPVGYVVDIIDNAEETGREAVVRFPGEPFTEYAFDLLTLEIGA
ncbi:hypothetical protein [Streptomyces sp. NBC_01304]|uniref:hypothetical protein n=1 Tax=Streptomyces sp. NBC_01304 TaxID=2903818 RepID=UPI002E0FE01B|nr:hypothetical protein OG430_44545 [Streptomyces sp. NBC_01304]